MFIQLVRLEMSQICFSILTNEWPEYSRMKKLGVCEQMNYWKVALKVMVGVVGCLVNGHRKNSICKAKK